MSLEGKSYGIMPYEDWYFIFKRIRLQFMRMLLRLKSWRLCLKSYAVAREKLSGCAEKGGKG